MTLDTNIYVHDAIDPRDVFAKCREMLEALDALSDDEESWREDGSRILQNRPMQGLSAWLMIHYRPDGPLCPDGDTCTKYCEPDEDYHEHRTTCYLEVSFDTAYGYSDEHGRGCGDLHACYVAELGQWLDARGIAWSWQNEFTGDIHGGEDRYQRLSELMQGGHRATRWFESWVLPAIPAIARDVT